MRDHFIVFMNYKKANTYFPACSDGINQLNTKLYVGPLYWSTVLQPVLCTGPLYCSRSSVLVLCTGPLYLSSVLVLCTYPLYWSSVLVHCTAAGPLYWSSVLVLCTAYESTKHKLHLPRKINTVEYPYLDIQNVDISRCQAFGHGYKFGNDMQ